MSQFVGGVAVDHILNSQEILPSGTFAIGIHDPSNQMKSVVHPVRYVSTPLASVINALFAVNPVRVQPIVLSLVVIAVVFAHIAVVSASRATLIDPDIDPRVNICASVIRDVAYVSCLATTVSIIDS
jgi:hypothetical protein